MNSKVASSLALRVSWLKFEPRSRIFPRKISQVAYFTAAIQREFFFLFLLDKNDSLTFVITHKVEALKKRVLSSGKMAKNTVIDGYKLNENGEWI